MPGSPMEEQWGLIEMVFVVLKDNKGPVRESTG